jgi:hypothetical protein
MPRVNMEDKNRSSGTVKLYDSTGYMERQEISFVIKI